MVFLAGLEAVRLFGPGKRVNTKVWHSAAILCYACVNMAVFVYLRLAVCDFTGPTFQERKFMSCIHGQELGQISDLASEWLCSQSGASLLVDSTLDNDFNS